MKGEIQYLYKNIRYKLVTIHGEDYIIDVDHPVGSILFPFLHWMLPQTVYKVNDENIVEKIKIPNLQQKKTSYLSIFGVGVSLLIANLIGPMMDYFNIEMSSLISSLIVSFTFLLVFAFRMYLSKLNKKKLDEVIKLNQMDTCKLWIRPKNIKNLLVCIFYYLFFLIFEFIGIGLFITYGNTMVLLFFTILTCFLLIANLITMQLGNTTVKFKNDKKTVSQRQIR
ncbi:DUF443 family protein [Virgibacillus salexigens]|uniref:DUF443 family protein n=1 Tax=Virgibacillus TaxID=84406 RepID=UPI00136A3342|nr:DUF443 family protein [Virgibacillus massiliensis]